MFRNLCTRTSLRMSYQSVADCFVQVRDQLNDLFDSISTLWCFQGSCPAFRGALIILLTCPRFVKHFFKWSSNFFRAAFEASVRCLIGDSFDRILLFLLDCKLFFQLFSTFFQQKKSRIPLRETVIPGSSLLPESSPCQLRSRHQKTDVRFAEIDTDPLTEIRWIDWRPRCDSNTRPSA